MPALARSSFASPARLKLLFALLGLFAISVLPAQLLKTVEAGSWPLFANPSSTVFINEFHYDNVSTDVGEFIEVAGPAGTDMSAYSIVLYNGANGLVYDTDALTGILANQQGGYGTAVINYPTNGIQNGAPDGIALVGPGNAVVQFLCYEGSFTAVDGPAAGVTCTDIGVAEAGSEPVGQSLQLSGSGSTYGSFSWAAPAAATAGSPNTGQTFGGSSPTPTPSPTASPTPTPTPGPTSAIVINELDSDTPGTDIDEFVELFDGGAGNTSLNGLVVVFFNGSNDLSYASFDLDGHSTDANGYFILGNANIPGVDLVFSNGLLQNGADAVAVYSANASDFPNNSAVTTANLVDAVVYDTSDADDPGLLVLHNPGEPQVDEGGGSGSASDSIGRCPNGAGGARNTSTYITFNPTPGSANNCPAPAVPRTIAEIQGSGASSPYAGTAVITTGVVTALKFNGFFLQEPDATVDSDPSTSEAIFVFTGSFPTAAKGDAVMVTGTAGEFFNLTQVSAAGGSVVITGTGNPLPTPIMLDGTTLDPGGPVDQLERLEGMRVFASELRSVAPTNSFGEIYTVLNGVDRPFREPGLEPGSAIPNDPGSGVPDCCIPMWDGNPERVMIDTDGLAGSTRIDVTSNVLLSNVGGPLDFTFGNYKIVPEITPTVGGPNSSAVAVRDRVQGEFTVAGYNIENFSNSEGQRRKAALAIRNVMKSPDVVGVIEILDLASLQALAVQINSDAVAAGDPDPGYTAFLIPSPGTGTQNVGFLVRSSVQVEGVSQERATETFINPTTGMAETLHDRPPLVLRATINPATDPRPIIVVVNHTRSFIDIERTDAAGIRVREKRKVQAESIADLLQELQTANPGAPVIAVGDYNAYQFNDGYTDPVATIKGSPTSDDEVVVEESPDLVDPDFINLTDELPDGEKYSFIFEGTPQAIDHVFVNPVAYSIVQGYEIARINTDFPESVEYTGPTRPELSSDHDAPVAFLRFPQRATTTTVNDLNVVYDAAGQNVTLSADVSAAINTVNEGTVTFTVTDTTGTVVIGTAGPASVSNGSASANFFLPGSVLPQELKIRAEFSGGLTALASTGIGRLNVSYAVCPLYNVAKPAKEGAAIPVRLQLCDVSGINRSAGSVQVRALFLSTVSDPTTTFEARDAGNSNPGGLFRFDPELNGYIFNLKTDGLTPGDYLLWFTAGSDPSVHSTPFGVR